ncbi:hypothetical protein [Methylobacterium oxalidis]|uniref:Uncharacterized protein n=1 Tax=Methylobacterium oxalidis TaxID=944322 RepID=A0A512J8D4_9HYPH|nr:hypothetical protein [Methylobacterium oxalidis]GEP06226.1 hypothetical protein MOX02_42640 [Methylobacterium oxalidis]GLS66109.1 hypothetical protein GCM10007888_44910 [Methylobacterium oxalidis]
MARSVTYSIVGGSDGRFAVVAVTASGSIYCRGGFRTPAEAELSVEDLRTLMMACDTALVHREAERPSIDLRSRLSASGPPFE